MSDETDPEHAPFGPPADVIEVTCIHCGAIYQSDELVKKLTNLGWTWCCRDEACDGVGFCFDIWPTDKDWKDENGHGVWIEDPPDVFDLWGEYLDSEDVIEIDWKILKCTTAEEAAARHAELKAIDEEFRARRDNPDDEEHFGGWDVPF